MIQIRYANGASSLERCSARARIMNYLRVCLGLALVGVWSLQSPISLAEDEMDDDALTMLSAIEANTVRYEGISRRIWNWAEVGYQEVKSSALLQQTLREEGFSIQEGVADIPTAFVASFGSGQPVIGILAEFDALPGITQSALPRRDELPNHRAGHACGHHLFGTASTAAAIA